MKFFKETISNLDHFIAKFNLEKWYKPNIYYDMTASDTFIQYADYPFSCGGDRWVGGIDGVVVITVALPLILNGVIILRCCQQLQNIFF